jgi:ComF family protein
MRCPRETLAWHVDAVIAPFSYAAPLDRYLHALKYQNARSLGRAFALLLAKPALDARGDIDALVAVPLHRTRLIERGYNQAQEIARALAQILEVPSLERGIARIEATAAQTKQGAARRRAGVLRAFRVSRGLEGLRIGIVDDVITTGATVNAVAAELRASGATRCIALAVARTTEPNQTLNV